MRCEATFRTHSRRPSAAAGCARARFARPCSPANAGATRSQVGYAAERSASRTSSATTSPGVLPRAWAIRSSRTTSSPSTLISSLSCASGLPACASTKRGSISARSASNSPGCGSGLSRGPCSSFSHEAGYAHPPSRSSQSPRATSSDPTSARSPASAPGVGLADEQSALARRAARVRVADDPVLVARDLLDFRRRDAASGELVTRKPRSRPARRRHRTRPACLSARQDGMPRVAAPAAAVNPLASLGVGLRP